MVLEYNPTTLPVVAFALRFADADGFVATSWPLPAELRRPDTWGLLDLSE